MGSKNVVWDFVWRCLTSSLTYLLRLCAGYQLEKKTPFGNWEKMNDVPILGESTTVPDLKEGEEYEYRIAAVTEAGVGDYSNATPPTKAERKKRKLDAAFYIVCKK